MANAKDTPAKGNSKAAAQAPARKATEKNGEGNGGSTAPRPRKWDYGLSLETATVVLVTPVAEKAGEEPKEPALRGTTKDVYATLKGAKDQKMGLGELYQTGATRHDLRVLSRGKHIKVVHPNGDTFPKPYVAPPPKPKAEPKAKAEKKVGETSNVGTTAPAA